MQRGAIRKHRGAWWIYYWDVEIRNGQRKRVRVGKRLAPISEYPSKASVRNLADDILAPINRKQVQPESSLLLTEFIEQHYFPGVEQELRHSTINGYKHYYAAHLKERLKKLDLRVRDVRTVHIQRLLRDIPNVPRNGSAVGHRTLLHIKSFLSGIFKFAKQEGIIDGMNPVTDTKVPGRLVKFRGVAYSVEDLDGFLERLERAYEFGYITELEACNASDVIVLLFWTGLRQSECRGLRWCDWDEVNQELRIERAVWRTHVAGTKTQDSESNIPIVPQLAEVLTNRRTRLNPNLQDYIFAGERRRTPLNLHNLETRVIKKVIKESESNLEWKGFHGFRRGLATNLLEVGVEPLIAARLLRHTDVSTTLEFYARAKSSEVKAAMERLQERITNRRKSYELAMVDNGNQNGNQQP